MPTSRELGIRAARREAAALLRRFGVEAPGHVNVEAIAAALGAEIVVAPLAGAAAQLVRVDRHARIVVSDREGNEGARRFSIAHELGHLVLEHPVAPAAVLAGAACSRKAGPADRDPEMEANAFAAELLMPERLARRRCDVSPVSLANVNALAETFNVSTLAAAIRFAELTSERCAAVYSQRGAVRWAVRSASFGRAIDRGARLGSGTVAYDYFQAGRLDDRAQPVAADEWFATSQDVEIVEHSCAIEERAAVLSMLWVPEHVAGRLRM